MCFKVSVVMDQFLRLLHTCGLPKTDVDFINCSGDVMEQFLLQGQVCLLKEPCKRAL